MNERTTGRHRIEARLAAVVLAGAGVMAVAGCGAGAAPGSDAGSAGSAGSAASSPESALALGEPLGEDMWGPFGANPTSVGDYRLLTPELMAEYTIPCGYDVITEYSDPLDAMLAGGETGFVTASYATEDGLANVQAAGDDACTGRVFGEPVNGVDGVIKVRITPHDGAYDGPLKEHYCGETLDERVCGQQYPSGLTVTARGTGTDAAVDHDFLLAFLQRYAAGSSVVQEHHEYGSIPLD